MIGQFGRERADAAETGTDRKLTRKNRKAVSIYPASVVIH